MSADCDEPDCEDALHTLYEFIDGELDDERRAAIQAHLDHCEPCLGAYDFEDDLRKVVAQRCRDQVPDALRARIADQLGL